MVNSSKYDCGLVVGKFSPLHLGHELLIQRAMRQCREVVLISYSNPELPGCAAGDRQRWLSTRFPEAIVLIVDDAFLLPYGRTLPLNEAHASVHREFVGWLCLHVLKRVVQAVFTSEDYGDGFAAELACYFEMRLGHPSPVVHVSVDPARVQVPVSGTQLRADPHAGKPFLAPAVYASFVQTVCFLGGESSGKTTIAEAMATRLRTSWVSEYGRQRWQEKNGVLEYADMEGIALEQIQREERYRLQANRYLFCDTSPLTTLFYSLQMFGLASERLVKMAKRRYHFVFLCAPDFAFVQDGTRQVAAFREYQHSWYLRELAERDIAYVLLSGPVQVRIETVLQHLR